MKASTKRRSRFRPGAWSWALYDWANSAFVLTVITVFYGPYFQSYWHPGPKDHALLWLGISVTISSLLVAACAPFLGALADSGPIKKRFLAAFAFTGALATVVLAFIPEGAWQAAVAVRIVASFGFFGSLIFYDSLINEVTTADDRHVVSGLGFSLGYLGSVLLFVVQFVVVSRPELLGLADSHSAIRLSFLSVAVWWILFTLPLLRNVPETLTTDARPGPRGHPLRACLPELVSILRSLFRNRALLLFLIAYYFYIDGVNTLTQMSTGFGQGIGVPLRDLMGTIILVQVVGVPCAVGMGWLAQRFHPKPLITVSIAIYLGVTGYAFLLDNTPLSIAGFQFHKIYLMGFLIGLVQGGMQALSRSTYAALIPQKDRTAGYFGLYNMLGKGGAILGPTLMGVFGAGGNIRTGALAVSILFIIGLIVVQFVPFPDKEEITENLPTDA